VLVHLGRQRLVVLPVLAAGPALVTRLARPALGLGLVARPLLGTRLARPRALALPARPLLPPRAGPRALAPGTLAAHPALLLLAAPLLAGAALLLLGVLRLVVLPLAAPALLRLLLLRAADEPVQVAQRV